QRAEQAASKADKIARRGGLSAAAADEIRRAILGIAG
ncbi:MAG: phage protein Gp27 family protein, partial [Betaproteobacteria bacterium]